MTCLRRFIVILAGILISLNPWSSMSTPVAAKASTNVAVSAHLLTLLSVTPALAMQEAAQTQAPPPEDPLLDGKGKDVTKRVCTACHAVTTFSQQRHSKDEWDDIVNSMVSKGLDASDDDLATVRNYLATYLGPAKPDSTKPPAGSSTN
jgi:cytochrome c5